MAEQGREEGVVTGANVDATVDADGANGVGGSVREGLSSADPAQARSTTPPAPPARRTRRRKALWFALIALVLCGGASWMFAGRTLVTIAEQLYLAVERRRGAELPPSDDPTPITFVIEQGETLTAVAQRLERDGLIRSARYMIEFHKEKSYFKSGDGDHLIQAGEHTLRRNMRLPEVYDALLSTISHDVTLTLVEGQRAEEVADALSAAGVVDRAQFLSLVADPPPATSATSDTLTMAVPAIIAARAVPSLEGYLYPDTYRFAPNAGTLRTLERILATFAEKVPADLDARAKAVGLDDASAAITLASIVQREGVRADELPKIARVYLNRLASPPYILNADPTLQYALGFQSDPLPGTWWKRPLYDADKQVDSPYNSYLLPGLPPGPIASPGLAAIEAVLAPADGPWMYFVASDACDGTHAFAVTYEEHLANVGRYVAAGCGG
ncbi:MAG: endolytic transglycosylase MltG [Ardenticatenales bacterium]